MITCDICDKPAEWNIQSVWMLWRVRYNKKREENYRLVNEWGGGENDHYCEEHAGEEGII